LCVRRWATSAVPRIISSSGAGTLRNDDTVGPGPAPSIQLRRVGESVYLVSFPEGRDVPAHALDDTGEVVAEDDRKLVFCRREQTAQRDGSVDAVHGGRADAYEQLVRTRLRDPAAWRRRARYRRSQERSPHGNSFPRILRRSRFRPPGQLLRPRGDRCFRAHGARLERTRDHRIPETRRPCSAGRTGSWGGSCSMIQPWIPPLWNSGFRAQLDTR